MNLKNEPAVIIGAITAFAIIVLNAVVVFWTGFSEAQIAALISVINGAGVLAGAFFVRKNVFSPEHVNEIASPSFHSRERLVEVDTGKLTKIAKRAA